MYAFPDAPIISPRQEPVVVQVDRPGMIQCGQEILSYPPASFTWTKPTKDGRERELLQFSVDQSNGSLLLSNANYSDSGIYTCTAENSIGTAYTRVTVLVLGKSNNEYMCVKFSYTILCTDYSIYAVSVLHSIPINP